MGLIIEVSSAIFLLGIAAVFFGVVYWLWIFLYKWAVIKERYFSLYELKGIEEALKFRGSSFKELDEYEETLKPVFNFKINFNKKGAIAKIDEQVEKSKKDFEELKKASGKKEAK